MRMRDGRSLTTLRAARDFLREHAEVLSIDGESGLVRRLDDTIRTLNAHSVAQVEHTMRAHGLVQTQKALCASLRRDHMTPIVRIARADMPHAAEFRALRMPAGRVRVDQLVSAARAMLVTAERFIDTFLAAGLPRSFVDDAHAVIRALLIARADATLARGRRHGATRGIDVVIVEAHRIVRALDSLIREECRRDVVLVAQWESILANPRLGRPRKKR
jgi:hypothetical protein